MGCDYYKNAFIFLKTKKGNFYFLFRTYRGYDFEGLEEYLQEEFEKYTLMENSKWKYTNVSIIQEFINEPYDLNSYNIANVSEIEIYDKICDEFDLEDVYFQVYIQERGTTSLGEKYVFEGIEYTHHGLKDPIKIIKIPNNDHSFDRYLNETDITINYFKPLKEKKDIGIRFGCLLRDCI